MKTPNPNKLAGKKAFISGGHSGIGLAIAQALQVAGVKTTVADISPAPAFTGDITSFACDITQADAIDKLYQEVTQHFGHPDVFISNAGQGIHEKLTEGDPEKWKKIIDLNVMGALRLIRAFVPGMLTAGTGDIIFISSVAAGKAFEYGGIYAASKSALQTIAETLRLEVLPHIRVTTIAPGVTDTAFFQNTISGFHTAKDIGYGALTPESVAETVLFALSQPPDVSINHITIRPTAQPF